MKKLIFLFTILTISTYDVYSQNRSIKGRVIDNHQLTALAFVSIIINDTVEVGRTNLNGYFQIDIPVCVNKLIFRSVGLEPASIELENNCDEIELVMVLNGTYDFITLKKVDKIRKKKYKKLPKLHRIAFKKDIFKREMACYKHEFIRYYKKTRK